MILGVGTDLVENRRLRSWLERPRLLARYFTAREIADARASADPPASLAARFAAKEAFGKALGTGLAGLRLADIETRRDSRGRPDLVLSGTARDQVARRGARAHLSLTHEGGFSLAFVILEAQ